MIKNSSTSIYRSSILCTSYKVSICFSFWPVLLGLCLLIHSQTALDIHNLALKGFNLHCISSLLFLCSRRAGSTQNTEQAIRGPGHHWTLTPDYRSTKPFQTSKSPLDLSLGLPGLTKTTISAVRSQTANGWSGQPVPGLESILWAKTGAKVFPVTAMMGQGKLLKSCNLVTSSV